MFRIYLHLKILPTIPCRGGVSKVWQHCLLYKHSFWMRGEREGGWEKEKEEKEKEKEKERKRKEGAGI